MGARLQDRVAIVTGAGRGLGRSVALLLASEGAAVVVNDLGTSVDGAGSSASPADSVVREIRDAGGSAVPSHLSVAQFQSAGEIVQTAVDEFGRLDILCNAAGILRDRMVFNMTEEEWDAILGVHLYGAFNMVRNSVPHMIEQHYGRIVLFSSSSGLGVAGQANYAAAKEGMVGLARSLAAELSQYGITVNAVYPGADTRMMATVPESTRQMLRAQEQDSPGGTAGPTELVASPSPRKRWPRRTMLPRSSTSAPMPAERSLAESLAPPVGRCPCIRRVALPRASTRPEVGRWQSLNAWCRSRWRRAWSTPHPQSHPGSQRNRRF